MGRRHCSNATLVPLSGSMPQYQHYFPEVLTFPVARGGIISRRLHDLFFPLLTFPIAYSFSTFLNFFHPLISPHAIALTMLSQPFGYNKRSMPLFGRSGGEGGCKER